MFETSVYKNRRARLKEKVKEKVKSGLVLILGNGEAPANYTDNTYSSVRIVRFSIFSV